MDPLELAEIGTTGLKVSRLGIGGVALGRSTTDDGAAATLGKCLELGVSYFDTAPYTAEASASNAMAIFSLRFHDPVSPFPPR